MSGCRDAFPRPCARIKAAEEELGSGAPILAHTDLVVVDENLQAIAPSFWSYSNLNPYCGSRLNRLLIQNVVTGSATMVNGALARLASPIPQEAVLHDWWLALIASALGRIEAIPERTVLYRQHGRNCLGATSYGWRYVMHRAGRFSAAGPRRPVFAAPRGKRSHYCNASPRICHRDRRRRSTPL